MHNFLKWRLVISGRGIERSDLRLLYSRRIGHPEQPIDRHVELHRDPGQRVQIGQSSTAFVVANSRTWHFDDRPKTHLSETEIDTQVSKANREDASRIVGRRNLAAR